MLNNEFVELNSSLIRERAEYHFIKICGFDRNPVKFKKMLDRGMMALENIKNQLDLKVIVSEYSADALQGNQIKIEDKVFTAQALTQIKQLNVLKIYSYLMTSGNLELVGTEDSLMDDFYKDTWGTAYIDGGRDLLIQWIRDENNRKQEIDNFEGDDDKKEKGIVISDSFGPGFYGMDVSQVKDFFSFMDGEKLGIHLSSGGMMIPVKSIAGFFIVMKEGSKLPEAACQNCIMEMKGCGFCRMSRRTESQAENHEENQA